MRNSLLAHTQNGIAEGPSGVNDAFAGLPVGCTELSMLEEWSQEFTAGR